MNCEERPSGMGWGWEWEVEARGDVGECGGGSGGSREGAVEHSLYLKWVTLPLEFALV